MKIANRARQPLRSASLAAMLPTFAVLAVSLALCGCGPGAPAAASAAPGETIVLLSVTSDAQQDPQSVDMAMRFAGFALDEGRRVFMFFNVKGVKIPSSHLADDFAYEQSSPLKEQLAALIQRGADVHVCPVCMKALGVNEGDLMEGAKVTTRASLFANIQPATVVFTY
jgi:predicted peroxiredoxin